MGKSKKHHIVAHISILETRYGYYDQFLCLRIIPILKQDDQDITGYSYSEIGVQLDGLELYAQATPRSAEFCGFYPMYKEGGDLQEMETRTKTLRKVSKGMDRFLLMIGGNAETPSALQHVLAFLHAIDADLVSWNDPNHVGANSLGIVHCSVEPTSHWRIKGLLQDMLDATFKEAGADDAQH